MEEPQDKQGRLQAIYQCFKDSLFGIMLELLKDKKSGQWYSCFLIVMMIVQMIAHLFNPDVASKF